MEQLYLNRIANPAPFYHTILLNIEKYLGYHVREIAFKYDDCYLYQSYLEQLFTLLDTKGKPIINNGQVSFISGDCVKHKQARIDRDIQEAFQQTKRRIAGYMMDNLTISSKTIIDLILNKQEYDQVLITKLLHKVSRDQQLMNAIITNLPKYLPVANQTLSRDPKHYHPKLVATIKFLIGQGCLDSTIDRQNILRNLLASIGDIKHLLE